MADVTKEASTPQALEDAGFQDSIDPIAEKNLVLKCDMHIIPILCVLFVLSFLDRINIGNARLQGLEEDLDMTGNDFSLALFIFFIPYILCEVPSNIILKKIAPSTWLSCVMLGWGTITICQGVTQSFTGLVVCRFLLGVLESGLVPGCFYLISMYYKRYELQKRVNVLYSATILAGAISGLLAYAIAKMDHVGGYRGWRWIFIIEGLVTLVTAAVSKPLIVDWPETAKFLDGEERDLLARRLALDNGCAKMDHLNRLSIKRVLSDVKIYLGIAMYFGIVNTAYATAFFTPTILHQLGWTALRAQIMAIPIFIAAAFLTLACAVVSDRIRHRFGFAILGCMIATVGYIMLLNQNQIPVGARYFAVYAITCGGYITLPVCLAWVCNNMGGHYKRAISSAAQIGVGNIGGIVASIVFGDPRDAPTYYMGYGVSLALVWVCIFSCTVLFFYLRRENRIRAKGERDYLLDLPESEINNLGDDHPGFKFTY